MEIDLATKHDLKPVIVDFPALGDGSLAGLLKVYTEEQIVQAFTNSYRVTMRTV